jgi:hypothetical protein
MITNNDIQTLIQSLKYNNFKVEYVEKGQDAVPLVLSLIPADAALEMAGSISVSQLGLLDLLKKRGNKGLEFPKPGDSLEDIRRTRKDVLLVSTNAITLDGKLVNTDGMGNRVTAMAYGMKKVVLVVGVNKIVRNLEEALERVQKTISPYHAKCIGLHTPCSSTGECADCDSPQRICNITTIISKKPPMVDFTIILVNEDLGLGWDPDWPEARKERIAAAYRAEMEKFQASFPPPPRPDFSKT